MGKFINNSKNSPTKLMGLELFLWNHLSANLFSFPRETHIKKKKGGTFCHLADVWNLKNTKKVGPTSVNIIESDGWPLMVEPRWFSAPLVGFLTRYRWRLDALINHNAVKKKLCLFTVLACFRSFKSFPR